MISVILYCFLLLGLINLVSTLLVAIAFGIDDTPPFIYFSLGVLMFPFAYIALFIFFLICADEMVKELNEDQYS